MKDIGWLITTYDQLDLTEKNIRHIRMNFPKTGGNNITVVSTHPDPDYGFDEICERYHVKHLSFYDAPGNPKADWFHRKAQTFISWRHEFMPPRIQMSMELGAWDLWDRGSRFLAHVHSDCFWKSEAEDMLIDECRQLAKNRWLFFADLSIDDENSIKGNGMFPEGLHIHPEMMTINLKEAKRIGYIFDISEIFHPDTLFRAHNYGANEAMFGQWAIYCYTEKNFLPPQNKLPKEYVENCRIRYRRTYHGNFPHGIHIAGSQSDAPNQEVYNV